MVARHLSHFLHAVELDRSNPDHQIDPDEELRPDDAERSA